MPEIAVFHAIAIVQEIVPEILALIENVKEIVHEIAAFHVCRKNGISNYQECQENPS